MSMLLHEWVIRQAEHAPDRIAVSLGADALTYGALDDTSNRLARLLHDAGVRPGDRVALLLAKSPTAVAAIVATLKAGAIYVPLDPASPAPRVAKMLASCEPHILLADRVGADVAAHGLRSGLLANRPRLGWLDAGAPPPGCAPVFRAADVCDTPPSVRLAPARADHPAYLMYTSGSTGAPKGVVITHTNVSHFVRWANRYFGVGPDDRLSGHAPLYFDLSTYDIFGTFAAGAHLHLVPPALNLAPARLVRFIRDARLTQWFSAPSVLVYMASFDAVRYGDFPALRRLLWCGEVFPTPALRYWMQRLPHVRFTNLYGPTEATVASSYYTVPTCPRDDREVIPIGTACDGEELLVLDERLVRVPPDAVGELCIRGVGLSPGYWRDAEKTRAAFLPNPYGTAPGDRIYSTGDLARVDERGLHYFLGRRDSQIKSRGHRIELGEIEAGVQAIGLARECAVVAVPTDGFAGALICCAYVPDRQAATPEELRRRLRETLPTYMLPSRWLALDALPRNANGKTDRPRIRELFEHREAVAH